MKSLQEGFASGGCGCKPATCTAISAYRGTQLDGCGGTPSCGACLPDGPRGNHNGAKVCIGAGPANCSEEGVTCTPNTCAKVKAQCGKLADGCGSILDCGSCTAPLVCGGSGIANQCGRKPLTARPPAPTAACSPTSAAHRFIAATAPRALPATQKPAATPCPSEWPSMISDRALKGFASHC